MMAKSSRQLTNVLVFTILGILLLFFAFKDIELEKLWLQMSQARPFWVLLAICCGILSHLSRAQRWRLLLRPLGHQPRLSTSFYAVMVGYLVNFAVPRLGEVIRPVTLNRTDKIPTDQLIGTVITERIIDLIMTVIITVVIIILQFSTISSLVDSYILTPLMALNWIKLALLGGILLVLLAVVYAFRKAIFQSGPAQKLKTMIMGLAEGMKSILKLKQLGAFVFHSVFIWTMYFFMSYLIFFALGATAHLGIDAGLTTLLFGTAAIIIPIPGGIGTFHTMVPAGLMIYGINDFDGKTYATLAHGAQMAMILIVGGLSVFLAARSSLDPSINDTENQ
jgi:hypothetical protein